MWSILHMAHPLIFAPYIDSFKESEREVFLALSQEVLNSAQTQLNLESDFNILADTLVLPVSRDNNHVPRITYPDYNSLGDLEVVIVSCKELDFVLFEQYVSSNKELITFADRIKAAKIDEDTRHKLVWLDRQRELFLANRAVNNFATEKAREVYINVCVDVYHILSPASRTSSGSVEAGDKNQLIPAVIGERVQLRHIKLTFIVFCGVMFVSVMAVLVYELTLRS